MKMKVLEKIKKHKKPILGVIVMGVLIVLIAAAELLYRYNYIPHRKYTSEELGYPQYVSLHDENQNGVDDQRDILEHAKSYVATKPKYKSKYYTSGYPDDEYGVCTDVVAFALQGAGYDLMTLVQEDIASNPKAYEIEEPDPNIDFRRVRNLKVYFRHTAISLTTDLDDAEAWQGGDIVIFEGHIGIISDHRNSRGIPFVIHNGNPFQASYEEDILEVWGTIVGHYRISE